MAKLKVDAEDIEAVLSRRGADVRPCFDGL